MKTIYLAFFITMIALNSHASEIGTELNQYMNRYCHALREIEGTDSLKSSFCYVDLSHENYHELSSLFFKISKRTGDIRFSRWDQLSKEERIQLENLEWDALNISGLLTTLSAEEKI